MSLVAREEKSEGRKVQGGSRNYAVSEGYHVSNKRQEGVYKRRAGSGDGDGCLRADRGRTSLAASTLITLRPHIYDSHLYKSATDTCISSP